MKNKKRQKQWERALVKRLGDVVRVRISGVEETLELINQELIRIGARLEKAVSLLESQDGHEDIR